MLPSATDLSVTAKTNLQGVLKVLDQTAQGIVFVLNPDQTIIGVITDGDVRRALLAGSTLQDSAETVANQKFVSCPVDATEEEIAKILSGGVIRHIPLLDHNRRVVDYACLHRRRTISVMEPYLNGNELKYVMDCVKSKWISSQGKYVFEFEKMFSDLHGGAHAVAVSNGTVALHLAMVALGIGPGDEVIVPDLTFAASVNTIIHAGATPVLVDVSPDTWCIDVQAIETAITHKTKAIMPVHLYGNPAHMSAINELAKVHKLMVIEDAAEALGALYNGKPVGTFSDAACFSFYGNKMITTGEGGMILFKDKGTADRARMLRDHGMAKDRRYWHLEVGYNYRMTNLQAAIGVAQLEQYEEILKHKLNIASQYDKTLKGCRGVSVPPTTENSRNVFWLYTILIDDSVVGSRETLMQKLLSNGIETRPVFFPMHEMPPYQKYLRKNSFPVAERISRTGLSLPSSAMLTPVEIERICSTLIRIMNVKQMVQTNSLGVNLS